METVWDVLVVGGGPAGCFAAIKAVEAGARRVALIDKGWVGKSGCATFGAGSFKAYIPGEDDYDTWFGKTVEAGCHINDQEWTEIHLREVFARVREMEAWGVEFERNPDGSYRRIEGQGSSQQRPIRTLMFHGPQLMDAMRRAVKRKGVVVVDKTMITHLLHARGDRGTIAGAAGFALETGEFRVYRARATVLAAGGQSYKSHYAYHKMVTGDAHVMGLEAGADVANYEFALHHLSYAGFDTTGMNVLQGLGGRFVNGRGEPFMRRYDPEHGDHANLNRLSAGMAMEVLAGRGPIYMDLTDFSPEDLGLFERVLPIMHRAFVRGGLIHDGRIRERLEWLSVNSGTVGFGGGLHVNTRCETNLRGLYAAGDATDGPAAGVEGYGAYAIPFATTSGARAGTFAAGAVAGSAPELDPAEVAATEAELFTPLRRQAGVEPEYVTLRVQEAIFPMDVYILRTGDRLRQALRDIEELKERAIPRLVAYDSHYLRMAVEARNMVRCAELFLRAAMERTETRGSHRRLDYPETDNDDWLKWLVFRQTGGRLTLRREDIPIQRFRLRPASGRVKDPVLAAVAAGR